MEFINMPRAQLTQAEEQQTKRSLFLGITIWFLHLNILNALISVACKWGGLTFPVGELSGLQFVEAILTLITIAAMLFLVYLPWRNWRSFQKEKPTNNPQLMEETEEKRQSLMAFITMMLNSFLVLYIIATFVPMFALKACGQA
jgi:type VI protein secretion system component VasK